MVSRFLQQALWAMLMVFPLVLSANNSTTILTTEVSFLSEQLPIKYTPDIILDMKACVRTSCIKDFYEGMSETGYQILLDDLAKYKNEKQLNDWLYYKLLVTTLEKLYEGKTYKRKTMHFTLTTWFLLSKAGYDTELTEAALSEAFLFVYSNDLLFDVPMLKQGDKNYLNLTALTYNWDTRGMVYRKMKFKHFSNEGKKHFSFDLKELPEMNPNIQKQKISFKCGEKSYSLDLEVDLNVEKVMEDYPLLPEEKYLSIPLSRTLSNSLIPQLKEIIEGKSQKEAIQIIVSFTRSGFKYKWDWDVHDDNKSYIAEQVFLNEFSDHEDRAALFICLVKELLDLPVIAIRYYDYITAAVALDEEVGTPVEYNGKNYFVCEPTSPSNSNKIGRFPNGMNKKTMEVIASY